MLIFLLVTIENRATSSKPAKLFNPAT